MQLGAKCSMSTGRGGQGSGMKVTGREHGEQGSSLSPTHSCRGAQLGCQHGHWPPWKLLPEHGAQAWGPGSQRGASAPRGVRAAPRRSRAAVDSTFHATSLPAETQP